MHVKRLKPGERAPDGWDFIEVTETSDGMFNVIAVVLHHRSGILGTESFPSRETAEQAGLAWVQEKDAKIVYLVTLNA